MVNKKNFLDSWNFHSSGEKADNKLINEYIKACDNESYFKETETSKYVREWLK